MDYSKIASEIDEITSQVSKSEQFADRDSELVRALIVQFAREGATILRESGSIKWQEIPSLLRQSIQVLAYSGSASPPSAKEDLPEGMRNDIGGVFDDWAAREYITGDSTVVGLLEGLASAVYDHGPRYSVESLDEQHFRELLLSAMFME
ncbi:hypothetical protein [Millisia brevis]|uniref:hypothetical protein n=1 Tax=Millisia brevis TaxID=264148 RepID=UPI0012ECE122|nr:hypothetical protein [Millisia brevis]